MNQIFRIAFPSIDMIIRRRLRDEVRSYIVSMVSVEYVIAHGSPNKPGILGSYLANLVPNRGDAILLLCHSAQMNDDGEIGWHRERDE